MIGLIIFLLKPFRRLVETMDADFGQFLAIIVLKLTLDNRKSKKLTGTEGKQTSNGLYVQLFYQILVGILFTLFLSFINTRFTYFYLAHIFNMTMMLMMIISEFSSVIFDTSENTIIHPLPVNGNTLSLARTTYIFIYLTLMTLSLSTPALILSINKFGIFPGLLFGFTLFLNSLFSLVLANILYLSVIKLAKGERLKNLLMYFQVAVAIILMLGYQFSLNMVNANILKDLEFNIEWYTFLIPPAYYAGFIESFSQWTFGAKDIIFIAEAVVLPPIMIYFTGKYLTPVFNRKLYELEQGERASGTVTKINNRNLWYRLMSLIFVRGSEQRAAFRIIWSMSGRERQFLQTILPAYGYVVIIIIMPFLTKKSEQASTMHLLILYAFLFMSATLPSALASGSNSGAGWIYKSLPSGSPSALFKGFLDACFARFFVPFFILGSGFVVWYGGLSTLPDIMIVLLSVYSFTLLIFLFQYPVFPFSTVKTAASGGAGGLKIILILGIAAGSGYVHKVLTDLGIIRLLLIPFYSLVIILLSRIAFPSKITWQSVDRVNQF